MLTVNGRPITIAGVNRVEFDPVQGRSISLDVMRKDAKLMKQMNFNATRCSHFPPHRMWLEICDEAGLYVVDEANIETHGFQVIDLLLLMLLLLLQLLLLVLLLKLLI